MHSNIKPAEDLQFELSVKLAGILVAEHTTKIEELIEKQEHGIRTQQITDENNINVNIEKLLNYLHKHF